MSNIFSTDVLISQSVPANVRTAYKVAGLTAPASGGDHAAAVATLPGAQQVVATLAAEALTTDESPAEYAARARDQYAAALATDALRVAFPGAIKAAHERDQGATVDRATEGLAPVFNRAVKKLTDAAKHLDADAPLDPEKALTADNGKHLIAAREALAVLSVLARLHAHRPLDGARSLAPLVNVLAIEGVKVEKAERHLGYDVRTLNGKDLNATMAVRKLATDAAKDTDAALVGVAAGRYPGVSLRLNDRAGLNATRRAVTDAHKREHVNPGAHDGQLVSR